jgi:phosphatidylglycerophosphate synthase
MQPCDAGASMPKNRVLASHLCSTLGYLCTLPNLMGYARTMLILSCAICHHLGYVWLPPLMYLVNLCVIDNLDGIVARRMGQCTQFGRILDIGTDVVSETVFTGCIAAVTLHSASLPACLTGYGLWLVLLLYRWLDTLGCIACIAITFAGNCWKDVRYPCPVTRWYYETNLGGYGLYIGYHSFLAAFYLAAEGQYHQVGYLLASLCLPAFLLRLWTGRVVDQVILNTLMQMDLDARKTTVKLIHASPAAVAALAS